MNNETGLHIINTINIHTELRWQLSWIRRTQLIRRRRMIIKQLRRTHNDNTQKKTEGWDERQGEAADNDQSEEQSKEAG